MANNQRDDEKPIVLASRVWHKFYEPIVLLASLRSISTKDAIPRQMDPLLDWADDKQIFQAFVNKLAHVCQRLRGGGAVTSFTVLEERGVVEYWFAVNHLEADELEATATFTREFLTKVGGASSKQRHVRKALLADVLHFGRPRVSFYLGSLRAQLEECCERSKKYLTDDYVSLTSQLCKLQDILSEGIDLQRPMSEYIEICVKTIRVLCELMRSPAGELVRELAANGRMPGMRIVECWSDLLHVMNRILTYPQSIQFMLLAHEKWPRLFGRVTVSFILSSRPNRLSTRNKSLTAESIVGRMTRKEKDIAVFRAYVNNLQAVNLDERIRREYSKESFAPIVHSEILLLDWLTKLGGTAPSRFFNNWAYIGSSKPTCMLCDLYFDQHPSAVGRRLSHGNLCPSWRLPDVLPYQGVAALEHREIMLNGVLQKVRKQTFEIVKKNFPITYKAHDSNTFSANVTLTSSWTLGSADYASTVLDEITPSMGGVNLED